MGVMGKVIVYHAHRLLRDDRRVAKVQKAAVGGRG
jgi:hypothetical protein